MFEQVSDEVIPRTYMAGGGANYCKLSSDLSTFTGMKVSSFPPPPQTDRLINAAKIMKIFNLVYFNITKEYT